MTKFILNDESSVTYSTEDYDVKDKFEYWREVVGKNILKMNCSPVSENVFEGNMRCSLIEDITIFEMHSHPLRFQRNKSSLGNVDIDSMIFTLTLSGRSSKSVNIKSFNTALGDIGVLDGSREQQMLVEDDIQSLVLIIPKARFGHYIKNIEDYNTSVILANTLEGQLASSYIQTIAESIGQLDAINISSVIDNLIQLLVSSLPNKRYKFDFQNTVQKQHLKKIKSYIQHFSSDPGTNISSIAEKSGISTRYLHKLFKLDDLTVAKYLLKCRLENSRRLLIDASAKNISVTQIAHQSGFNDLAHFSKSFKKNFYLPPKEYRAENSVDTRRSNNLYCRNSDSQADNHG
jgi:Transcriptional regulator containing an amidase domain and an AraC-type DNA-binding HTH domain